MTRISLNKNHAENISVNENKYNLKSKQTFITLLSLQNNCTTGVCIHSHCERLPRLKRQHYVVKI